MSELPKPDLEYPGGAEWYGDEWCVQVDETQDQPLSLTPHHSYMPMTSGQAHRLELALRAARAWASRKETL